MYFLAVVYGSWVDHLLSWERNENGNTLFVYYESLKKVGLKLNQCMSKDMANH